MSAITSTLAKVITLRKISTMITSVEISTRMMTVTDGTMVTRLLVIRSLITRRARPLMMMMMVSATSSISVMGMTRPLILMVTGLVMISIQMMMVMASTAPTLAAMTATTRTI
jgi:hypothetical protein